MNIAEKIVLVTGGSRGLGLGLVEMLNSRGAKVIAIARSSDALEQLRQRLPNLKVIEADVTERQTAIRILAENQPDIIVLNAGAKPPMGRLDEISWADFSETWDTDVKAGLYWFQAALNVPLKPGSRVVVISSGAAESGSPLSGGYAGAKKMLWILAKYANGVAEKKKLNLHFQAVLPMQMIAGTGVGDTGAKAYANEMGVTPAEFLTRFGAPLPPHEFGSKVIEVLQDPKYATGLAFGLKGGVEPTILEERRR